MIGRADIEESKSNVAMNAWLPQASYPCGNFSDTSSLKFLKTKGSIGHAFTVCIHTENQNQRSFYPFVLHEISVLIELLLGHLCYRFRCAAPAKLPTWLCLSHRSPARQAGELKSRNKHLEGATLPKEISKLTSRVVVFHRWLLSHLFYASQVNSPSQTRVKLNRVFFPRWLFQARSLGCGFARKLIGTVGISLIHSCASLIRWRGIWLP